MGFQPHGIAIEGGTHSYVHHSRKILLTHPCEDRIHPDGRDDFSAVTQSDIGSGIAELAAPFVSMNHIAVQQVVTLQEGGGQLHVSLFLNSVANCCAADGLLFYFLPGDDIHRKAQLTAQAPDRFNRTFTVSAKLMIVPHLNTITSKAITDVLLVYILYC